MTANNKCVFCFLAVAVAVASGFNDASTKEPTIRIARSPQSSITDAIFGANLQFVGQAARSGQSVLESKLSAARAMVESGSDMLAAKVQAARDMAGVALSGGKTIAGTTLGTLSDTADGLATALGYPVETSSRRRRDSEKEGNQRYDKGDRKDDEDEGDKSPEDEKNNGDDKSEQRGGTYDDKNDESREKKSKEDGKNKSRKKDSRDDGGDDKTKSNKKNNREKRGAEENSGKRDKRSLDLGLGRNSPDGFETVGLIGPQCMGCKAGNVMSRTIALKGAAVGAVGFTSGGNKGATGTGLPGAGLIGISGGLEGMAGIISRKSPAGAGTDLTGLTGAADGGLGGRRGDNDKAIGLVGYGKGNVKIVGRKRREARRFGGGRSRFLPARGGGSRKGQSDSSSHSESSGSSSANLRQKRAIVQHVMHYLRRDKRQDDSTASADGKKNCHSFHSFEEDEEEKKFWENFHNMMNEHEADWDFDFEAEMCGKGGGSTGAVSTNAVEGAPEATTPLPPTIDT